MCFVKALSQSKETYGKLFSRLARNDSNIGISGSAANPVSRYGPHRYSNACLRWIDALSLQRCDIALLDNFPVTGFPVECQLTAIWILGARFQLYSLARCNKILIIG